MLSFLWNSVLMRHNLHAILGILTSVFTHKANIPVKILYSSVTPKKNPWAFKSVPPEPAPDLHWSDLCHSWVVTSGIGFKCFLLTALFLAFHGALEITSADKHAHFHWILGYSVPNNVTHSDQTILANWWSFHTSTFTYCCCYVDTWLPPPQFCIFLKIRIFKLHLFNSLVVCVWVLFLAFVLSPIVLLGNVVLHAHHNVFVHPLMGIGAVASFDCDEWNRYEHLCSSHLLSTPDIIDLFHFL